MRQLIRTAVWKAIRRNAAGLFFVVIVPSVAGTVAHAHHVTRDVTLDVDGAGLADVLPDDAVITITYEDPPAISDPSVAPKLEPTLEPKAEETPKLPLVPRLLDATGLTR